MKALRRLLLATLLFAAPVLADDISGPAGRFIKVGDTIDRHGDVDTTGKMTGSCFVYDASSGNWEAGICPGSAGASTLNVAVGGVSVSSPTVTVNFSSHAFTGAQSPSGTSNISINFSSITARGNTFNSANNLVLLDSSGYIPNANIDPSSVSKFGLLVDLGTETAGNYVESVTGGLAMSVTGSGEGAAVTAAFNPAGLTGSQTFSNGASGSIIWSWSVIGTDPSMEFSHDSIEIPNNVEIGANLIANIANITTALFSQGQSVCLADGTDCDFFTGGEANIAISSNSVIVSSPTSKIDFLYPIQVALVGSSTAQVSLNPSSATLLGAEIALATETSGIYVASITTTAPLSGGGQGEAAIITLDIDRSSFTLLGSGIDVDELPLHGFAHENGEVDEIDVGGLSGVLAASQNVTITTGTTDIATSTRIAFGGAGGISVFAYQNTSSMTVVIDASGISGATGDITAVIASTGLAGGGTSGDVTLSVDNSTVTMLGPTIEESEISDFGTYLTSETDPNAILNQSTLQTNSTSYPQYSYVGSSQTVYGPSKVVSTIDGNFGLESADTASGPKGITKFIYGVSAFGIGPNYRISVSTLSTIPSANAAGQTEFRLKAPVSGGDGEIIALVDGAQVLWFLQDSIYLLNGNAAVFSAESSTFTSNSIYLSNYDCSGNSNGGALTVDANGLISCSDDASGGGSSDKVSMTTGTIAGNWSIFYSSGDARVKELALGADGEVLRSNGASAVPSFSAVTTSSASANPSIYFKDIDTVDDDVNGMIDLNCTDTGSGTEDCDLKLSQQIAGSTVAVLSFDADGSVTPSTTQTWDFTNAVGLRVPNGINPTTDAEGEIAIDTSTTSGSMLRAYAGGVARAVPFYNSRSFVITGVTSAGDFGAIASFPYAVTIRRVRVLQAGATNVVGHLDECDSNGASCAGVDGATDITATATTATDDGSLSNASIDADDMIGWHTTSVSGTNTRVTVIFDYTVDQAN